MNQQGMKNHIYLLAISLLIFAGCKVGKNYQRPELPLPEKFEYTTYADTSTIADIEWSTFFSDTTLLSLIEKGIQKNYDLQLAIKNIDVAQQQVIQARLLQFPRADLQVTGQYTRPSKNSIAGISAGSFLGSEHIENYLASVNLSWEADIWGRIRRQKEATLAEYLRTFEAGRAVQTEIVATIARAWFNLLMLDKQLEITRRNLQLRDSTVQLSRALRDAGEITTLALQQAEVQKQNTELLIPQLQQDIQMQENALKVLTGEFPGAVERSTRLDDISVNDQLPVGLPAAIVSRRPDVRAVEMEIVAANARAGVAQANMYPVLTITAGIGLESFKSSNWFNIPGSVFGLAAGSLIQPLFRQRELRTQYEIAQIQREQAVIRFKQSVLQSIGEISDALVQTDKLKEQETIAVNQVDLLRSAIGNAQLLFKSDMANYLEVIIAQTNMLQAELNLASIQRQRLDAMVELYRSLGGGWK